MPPTLRPSRSTGGWATPIVRWRPHRWRDNTGSTWSATPSASRPACSEPRKVVSPGGFGLGPGGVGTTLEPAAGVAGRGGAPAQGRQTEDGGLGGRRSRRVAGGGAQFVGVLPWGAEPSLQGGGGGLTAELGGNLGQVTGDIVEDVLQLSRRQVAQLGPHSGQVGHHRFGSSAVHAASSSST